jgi:integrase
VRVRLKGLNRTKRRLADGTSVIYYYAFKGGPRLPGELGSPEFMAAYHAAHAKKREPDPGTLQSLLNGFQASTEWDELRPRTQKDYVKLIKAIEGEFGDFPLSAMLDLRTRGVFLAWRDERAKNSRKWADYGWTVLARVLSWAHGRGLVATNPFTKAGRIYHGSRAENVWSDADEAAFLAKAPSHLHLALLLALWTGQRQGDLLALTWAQYDGTHIRLKQGKTNRRVVIKVGAPLKVALDAAKKPAGRVLLTRDGEEWTGDGFRASFKKACAKAGVEGVTFNDMRGTAVTRLAQAECTVPEIATITGHSLKDVHAILDSHYLNRDQRLGDKAIEKLETRTKIPN